MKWAYTMPSCVGNPLYHWTHLELKKYFGIEEVLSLKSAEFIWNRCNELLEKDEFTARELILRSNVKILCTTDDPVDSLEYHREIAEDDSFDVKVLPAFRPDKSFNIDKPGFKEWISVLEKVSSQKIESFEDLKGALKDRLKFFHSNGCRISDHGLDPMFYKEGSLDEAQFAFKKAMAGEFLNNDEIEKYKTQVMLFLGREYARLGWTMQLHMGTLRNVNKRMMTLLGPDTGFDAIGDWNVAQPLVLFMNKLDETDELPKTILYSLNPSHNEALGTIMGCFQTGATPGKIQWGSAWWFNDHKDGMERQLKTLANLGLLSRFVGMLTDSRSFLSYTRHEYFRRILCNLIGNWVEKGEVPFDRELLGSIVEDICYNNAKRYFGII